MTSWRPQFGANSPFTGEERETIDAVVDALSESTHPNVDQVLGEIRSHFDRLESFGDLLSQFPSPVDRHRLGRREQNLASLAETLCQSNPANFEFRAPTRALVGRALDMAESNFYRLLRHACDEVLLTPEGQVLREQAGECLRAVIHTKLVEEVLSGIVSDPEVERETRHRAVRALIHIWDRRLTYRTQEFFPLLQAAWEARQKIRVVGGTLIGTQEMFGLFREGCDPEFVDYFVRPNPDDEEVAAFREFLFGKMSEELESMAAHMKREGLSVVSFGRTSRPPDADPGTRLYEFFRARFLQASARRLAHLPGPKRTAEGYVMIDFLRRVPA